MESVSKKHENVTTELIFCLPTEIFYEFFKYLYSADNHDLVSLSLTCKIFRNLVDSYYTDKSLLWALKNGVAVIFNRFFTDTVSKWNVLGDLLQPKIIIQTKYCEKLLYKKKRQQLTNKINDLKINITTDLYLWTITERYNNYHRYILDCKGHRQMIKSLFSKKLLSKKALIYLYYQTHDETLKSFFCILCKKFLQCKCHWDLDSGYENDITMIHRRSIKRLVQISHIIYI